MHERVDAFLDQVAAWAAEQQDVHVALLLGSQARSNSPADELSDVDVVLFVDKPERYLRDPTWTKRFGEPLLSFVEATPVSGIDERRVLFRDGLEVDFSFAPSAAGTALPADAAPILTRGLRVLYGDFGLEVPALPEPDPPPTQAQLDRLANDFWYHLLWAAKKLRRGEVLQAKQACDGHLTGLLVELARWRGYGRDTWHGFRFFECWAGEDLVGALGPTFAAYDAQDAGRALRAKGDLFGRLEDDVVRLFDLEAPVDRGEILKRLGVLLG
jgi:aminoglycoside 6-adenylyltransferase